MAAADRINHLNSALMVASCAAAFLIPFELFLLAYAVLGPLHYLTEISWIHDRNYFVDREHAGRARQLTIAWLLLVGLTLAVMIYGLAAERLLASPASPVFEIGLFYLVFVAAALIIFRVNEIVATGLILLTGFGLLLFSGSPYYGLIAFFIITIVHVMVFTAAFLLHGALKTRSRSGIAAVAVYALCVASFFLLAPAGAAVGLFVRESYQPFETLNAQLIQLLGLGPGTALAEIYESPAGAAVMRLIAFAYTYLYLNWFTKTSVIGWHRISTTRGIAILLLWLAALGVYAWNYLLGFALLYSLSVLHVMLELPLNHHSFAGIGRELGRLFGPTRAPPSVTAGNGTKLRPAGGPSSSRRAASRPPSRPRRRRAGN
jgi:hypothetical protein